MAQETEQLAEAEKESDDGFLWSGLLALFFLRRNKKRSIKPREIETLNDGWISAQEDQLVELGDRLADGEITLGQFQRRAGAIVSDIVSASFALGVGGWQQVPPHRKKLQQLVAEQLYAGRDPKTRKRFGIKHLSDDIRSGTVSRQMLSYRLRQFAKSGRRAYFEGQRAAHIKSSKPYGKRMLNKNVEHCRQCVEYGRLPPLPANDLVMPTERCDCRNNCQCSILWMSLEEAVARGARP